MVWHPRRSRIKVTFGYLVMASDRRPLSCIQQQKKFPISSKLGSFQALCLNIKWSHDMNKTWDFDPVMSWQKQANLFFWKYWIGHIKSKFFYSWNFTLTTLTLYKFLWSNLFAMPSRILNFAWNLYTKWLSFT